MRERNPTLLSWQPWLGGHQNWTCSRCRAGTRASPVEFVLHADCSCPPVLSRHRADLAAGESMLTYPWSATGNCGYDLLKLMQWLGLLPDEGATTADVEPQSQRHLSARGCHVVCASLCQPLLAPLLQVAGDDLKVCAKSLQHPVNCPIQRSITAHCRQLLSSDYPTDASTGRQGPARGPTGIGHDGPLREQHASIVVAYLVLTALGLSMVQLKGEMVSRRVVLKVGVLDRDGASVDMQGPSHMEKLSRASMP